MQFKANMQRFYQRRRGGMRGEDARNGAGRLLHAALLGGIDDECGGTKALRRASLCVDGTPVLYSLKLHRQQRAPSFRMLVEPGSTALLVPEQINASLSMIDDILHQFGWTDAVEAINAAVARTFNYSAREAERLWGGVWLGCEISDAAEQLRIYLNLRLGSADDRWQRVYAVLGWFGGREALQRAKGLGDELLPHAIPVGLALAVQGRVRCIRLYAGMHAPAADSLLLAGRETLGNCRKAVRSVCGRFEDAFGPFRRQSVTVGFDFSDDAVGGDGERVKMDISCQGVAPEHSGRLVALIDALAHDHGFSPERLSDFLDDQKRCFGGAEIEYVSFGFGKALEHLTVYTRPQYVAATVDARGDHAGSGIPAGQPVDGRLLA